ncbi:MULTISPECIES: cation-translocating P-type ATPase [Thiorhodovibrio]|uniref:cation-translocating P-type ATPase n=1 Tax=Thiorhodovibrio TaxID=61593 RepID=UPI001911E150|nr:HAD-IC family P-type ATPase [Thiorhodovibrio litoralis]MBK5967442.1 ATPase [Thiorhodovibrio winogradskyi]
MLWYQLPPEDVLSTLETDDQGLSSAEATKRQATWGENAISVRKTPAWERFLKQFKDPMSLILLATAMVTGLLTLFGAHLLPDTMVILSVVVLNACVGFYLEGKAENAIEALKSMMVPECMVLRDQGLVRIPSKGLVPGDIVELEGGDKIPADVRFIRLHNAQVDESSLTGESVPVTKTTNAIEGDQVVPGDQKNMGFSGTYLTQGTAKAVVVEIGDKTVFGEIAGMVKAAAAHSTPLQRKLARFIKTLIIAIMSIGTVNFVVGIYLGYEISYSLLGAISLVVAAIPEMLPALVTAVLAKSGNAMARQNAIVANLPAAETLGATSVICSDKTGTLTENRMTVTDVFAAGQAFGVSGVGYDLHGQFSQDGAPIDAAANPALRRMLEIGFFCNNAHLNDEGHSIGDPTEIALLISGAKAALNKDRQQRIEEIPFDSSTKYMAVLADYEGERYIFVKGAPEILLEMCASATDAKAKETDLNREAYLEAARTFARQALRTLGFAFKRVANDHADLLHEDLHDLCFAGLQGMIDPPKESAKQAVANCKSAGIRTVMVTGDHPLTAQAVAGQLGIPAERVLAGTELNDMDSERLRREVEEVSVFARVAPEHKQQIAAAFQANGHVVAMTGDGVNDAPALKQADIGVAMGQEGTEVARQAADMVLADDNFATIVTAVEEGRHAWKNLQKAILYTLPTNAAQALLIMGAILMAAFVPLFGERFVLEPIQILWINLLDSLLLTLPLMMEPKERGLLTHPPRDSKANIIDGLFIQRVILLGIAISLPGFGIYYLFGAPALANGELINPLLLTQAQTAAFWAILFAHFGYVFSARSIDQSVFSFSPFSNKWLLAGVGLSIAIRLIPTFAPATSSWFKTADFPILWWPLILLCFLPSLLAIEADKYLRQAWRRSQWRLNRRPNRA